MPSIISKNTLIISNERNQFRFLYEDHIKNFIFITTDIHYDVTVKLSQDFDKMEIYLHFMK